MKDDYFVIFYKKDSDKGEVEKIVRYFGHQKIIEMLMEMLGMKKEDRPKISIYKGECIGDLS